MPDTLPNLGLPLLVPSQAQKTVTHNEALLILDSLVQLAVLDRDRTEPPGLPAPATATSWPRPRRPSGPGTTTASPP